MTPAYVLTQPSAHPVKPTLNRSQMSGLKGTAEDLKVLIQNTRSYLTSPHSDAREKLQLEAFLESLQSQLDDVNAQLSQASD